MTPQRVSAVIPTKNVAEIIIPTLESLRFCDEVVIVDMFSTDGTREICERYPNVRVIQRDDYIYGNFNHGAEEASGDWIIRIDSDEVIGDELRQSIQAVLRADDPTCDSYEAFCHLYFFGMRLRHGFGDQWRTMLFRKGTARYPVRSEHEGLVLAGPQGKLDGFYSHFTNPTISVWLQKINYYSDRDIERLREAVAPRRWRVAYETLRIFQRFYLGPGWLIRDGYLGFVVAGMTAFAIFLQHVKTWEKACGGRSPGAPSHPPRA